MCPTGSAHAELTHGLSRMMGNHQVRFLGEGAAEMPLPYPTPTILVFAPVTRNNNYIGAVVPLKVICL